MATSSDPRHRAWDDIHDLLPAGWQVGPVTHDPGLPGWTVTARSRKTGRGGKPPDTITGQGEDELAALTYLALKLRELDRADRMADMERRARLAYYRGAQDGSFEATGAPMTSEVQDRVIERYPPD